MTFIAGVTTTMVSDIDTENVAVVTTNLDAIDTSTMMTHGINTAASPDDYAANQNSNNTINQFIVRMEVSPFHNYPLPKITPAHHTRRLPITSWSLLSFVDKEPIEAEWKAIFQHWNDVLNREKATLLELAKGSVVLPIFLLAATFNVVMFLSMYLDPSKIEPFGYLFHEPSIFEILFKTSYYSLPLPLWVLMVKDVIRTHLRHGNNNYSSGSTNTTNIGSSSDDSIDTNRHYQNTVITHHLLLLFDNMSGCVLYVSIFGFWFVAIFIVYRIEHYGWAGWCYVAVFFTPMVLVSLYVLYHIGGCTALCLSYNSRFEKHNHQSANLLKKVYFEIKGHNDLLTYFVLQPKINFDSRAIVIDIYAKSTTDRDAFENSGNLLPSVNLGVTKRRGGGNNPGCNVMIDGGSDDQQQLRIDHPHHYEDDGLTTPLLKDTTI